MRRTMIISSFLLRTKQSKQIDFLKHGYSQLQDNMVDSDSVWVLMPVFSHLDKCQQHQQLAKLYIFVHHHLKLNFTISKQLFDCGTLYNITHLKHSRVKPPKLQRGNEAVSDLLPPVGHLWTVEERPASLLSDILGTLCHLHRPRLLEKRGWPLVQDPCLSPLQQPTKFTKDWFLFSFLFRFILARRVPCSHQPSYFSS